MPRKAKGPRIYERKRKGRAPVFVIRDGTHEESTGAESREQADLTLAEYIKRQGRLRVASEPDQITCGQVLEIYAEEHAITLAAPERVGYAIMALDPFFGDLPASAPTGPVCRRYAATRYGQKASPSTVRRELGVLAAALRYCQIEGYLTSAPLIWRPEEDDFKDRWLTRQEAYYLLRGARRLNRDGRHLAWWLVGAYYTGTRKSAILALEITDRPTLHHGRIDPVTGLLHRAGSSERRTKKKRGSAKVPRQLLCLARARYRAERRWLVMNSRGERVDNIRTGFERAKGIAVKLAKKDEIDLHLDDVTPHTLKHTAITWAMQRGAKIEDASSYFDTSIETLKRRYWHHHPDFQQSAVEAMERK